MVNIYAIVINYWLTTEKPLLSANNINTYFSLTETLSKYTSTKHPPIGPHEDFNCRVIPPLTSDPVRTV